MVEVSPRESLSVKDSEAIFSKIIAKVNKNAVKRGYTTADRPVIGRASDMAKLVGPRIKTGNELLDHYIGGGLKRGTSSLWFGPKGVGKSTAAITVVAEVTQNGGNVLWIQAEEGDIFELMKLHGVTEDRVWIVNAKGTAEACFDIVEEVLEANRENRGFVDLIVIDSIAGLAPKSELEKIEKQKGRDEVVANPGQVAKAYSDWYRGLHSTKLLEDCHMILISQIREKIGGYGNPEIFIGGKGMEHAPRLLVRVSLGPNGNYVIKKNDLKYHIGHQVKYELTKDGVSHKNQGRQFVVDVWYGIGGKKRGIDNGGALQQILIDSNAFIQSGAIYTTRFLDLLPEDRQSEFLKFKGKEAIKAALGDPVFNDAAKQFLNTNEDFQVLSDEELESSASEDSVSTSE